MHPRHNDEPVLLRLRVAALLPRRRHGRAWLPLEAAHVRGDVAAGVSGVALLVEAAARQDVGPVEQWFEFNGIGVITLFQLYTIPSYYTYYTYYIME